MARNIAIFLFIPAEPLRSLRLTRIIGIVPIIRIFPPLLKGIYLSPSEAPADPATVPPKGPSPNVPPIVPNAPPNSFPKKPIAIYM